MNNITPSVKVWIKGVKLPCRKENSVEVLVTFHHDTKSAQLYKIHQSCSEHATDGEREGSA